MDSTCQYQDLNEVLAKHNANARKDDPNTSNQKNTHTRIPGKNSFAGSYIIPKERLPEFYALYYDHIFVKKKKEYLTEKQLDKDGPLLNEPGVTKHHNEFDNYTKIIEYSNIDVAVGDVVNKKQGLFLPFFDVFYHVVLENFQKNYEEIIKFLDKKIDETKNNESKIIKGGFYNMTVTLDYPKLKEKITTLYSKKNIQILLEEK